MKILRLPPLFVLVVVLALAAYMVYHMASTGDVQPVAVIILLFLGFVLIQILFGMMRKSDESESEID